MDINCGDNNTSLHSTRNSPNDGPAALTTTQTGGRKCHQSVRSSGQPKAAALDEPNNEGACRSTLQRVERRLLRESGAFQRIGRLSSNYEAMPNCQVARVRHKHSLWMFGTSQVSRILVNNVKVTLEARTTKFSTGKSAEILWNNHEITNSDRGHAPLMEVTTHCQTLTPSALSSSSQVLHLAAGWAHWAFHLPHNL